jgi:hypothetical protein
VTRKFELNRLPRNCSVEDIATEIRRVDTIIKKDILTAKDFDLHGKISSSAIKKKFGDWKSALNYAGLAHKYSGRNISSKMRQQNKHLTDDAILEEIRSVASKLGKDYVSQEDITFYSNIISASTVIYRFGSWFTGINKAGLKTAPAYRQKLLDDEYFENILNVWTFYGRQPLLREMDDVPSTISSGAYENHFGKWYNALNAFVSKMNNDVEEMYNAQMPIISDSEHQVSIQSATVSKSMSENRHEIKLGLRYKILYRDNFRCTVCGSSPATDQNCKLHVDHNVPFSKGGKTVPDNLRTLCDKCNLGKGNRFFD